MQELQPQYHTGKVEPGESVGQTRLSVGTRRAVGIPNAQRLKGA